MINDWTRIDAKNNSPINVRSFYMYPTQLFYLSSLARWLHDRQHHLQLDGRQGDWLQWKPGAVAVYPGGTYSGQLHQDLQRKWERCRINTSYKTLGKLNVDAQREWEEMSSTVWRGTSYKTLSQLNFDLQWRSEEIAFKSSRIETSFQALGKSNLDLKRWEEFDSNSHESSYQTLGK